MKPLIKKQKLNNYAVLIYELPYTYYIEAKNKKEAERIIMKNHCNGNYEDIEKVKVIKQ